MSLVGILLLIIHIIACTGLILIVLLQAGKGASLGASFGGGSSQTVFGARSATFIGRLTWVLAGAFMATSLLLTVISPYGTKKVETGANILHEEPVSTPAKMPSTGVPLPAGEWPQQALPGTAPMTEKTPGAAATTQQGEKTSAPATPAKSPAQPKTSPKGKKTRP